MEVLGFFPTAENEPLNNVCIHSNPILYSLFLFVLVL